MVERWKIDFTDSVKRSLSRIAAEFEQFNDHLDTMTDDKPDDYDDFDKYAEAVPQVLRVSRDELPTNYNFFSEALASLDPDSHEDAPDPHRAIAWLIVDIEDRLAHMPDSADISDYEKGRLDGYRATLMQLRSLEMAMRRAKEIETDSHDND